MKNHNTAEEHTFSILLKTFEGAFFLLFPVQNCLAFDFLLGSLGLRGLLDIVTFLSAQSEKVGLCRIDLPHKSAMDPHSKPTKQLSEEKNSFLTKLDCGIFLCKIREKTEIPENLRYNAAPTNRVNFPFPIRHTLYQVYHGQ